MSRFACIFLSTFVLCAASFGQTQTSRLQFSASNMDYAVSGGGLYFAIIDEMEANDGTSVSGTFESEWSGLNRNWDNATMYFSGEAWAHGAYGTLKTYSSGGLYGSFYNEDNDPFMNSQTGFFDPNGVPDVVDLYAQAGWSDKLRVGSTATNYYSTWIFDVSGINAGEESFGYLTVRIGNNPAVPFYFGLGSTNERLRVSQYIVGGVQEDITFNLYSFFQPTTQYFDDGVDIIGSSDFGHTVTLEGIELRNEPGGDLLSGIDLVSASGYQYELVPETATLGALGLGVVALLRKRRKH